MTEQREQWSSHFGFIMAAAGAAIGLGTLWLFPYLIGQNGGGYFVLIYLCAMFFVGFPIFIAELVLGRKAQKAPVGLFGHLSGDSPFWKGLGWLGVAGSLMIMSYYSVVAGWGLHYFVLSLGQAFSGPSPEAIGSMFDTLQENGYLTTFWHLLFSGISVSIVYMGVQKGIESASKIITTLLLLMLLALFCFGYSLEGFSEAFHFVFYPDISKVTPASVLEALGLSFFTLSLGQGVMLTYGSYMGKSDDIPRTAMIVLVMDVLVSLLSAMIIFPMIFTFHFEPKAGPGLIFKILPVVFSKLPGTFLLSSSFFVLFVFTALTTAVSFVEVFVANAIEVSGWSRRKACFVAWLVVFTMGVPCALSGTHGLFSDWNWAIGKDYFEMITSLVSSWILPISGTLTAIFTGWKLRKSEVMDEFLQGTAWSWLFRPWFFMVKWFSPLATVLIILYKSGVLGG